METTPWAGLEWDCCHWSELYIAFDVQEAVFIGQIDRTCLEELASECITGRVMENSILVGSYSCSTDEIGLQRTAHQQILRPLICPIEW